MAYDNVAAKWKGQSNNWMHEEKDSSKECKRLIDQTTTHPTKVLQNQKKMVLKKESEDLKKKTSIKKQVSQQQSKSTTAIAPS